MASSKITYHSLPERERSIVREDTIEYGFIGTLQKLKYEYRPDITNRATLEANFREKFEALNRVHLTDAEFARLLDEITTPDVFTASKTLRSINSFVRDDGTPLNYTLVNIKDWCKNTFEVINQLRIATCLSSLDALITVETQKLEALKTHKKGLMQQLFPAPTEQAHTSEGQRPGLFPSPEEVEA